MNHMPQNIKSEDDLREAMIASARRDGIYKPGKMPPTAKIPGSANPREYLERYKILARRVPAEWTKTVELAEILGLTRQNAQNVLCQMRDAKMIDCRMVNRKRQWRALS